MAMAGQPLSKPMESPPGEIESERYGCAETSFVSERLELADAPVTSLPKRYGPGIRNQSFIF